jgi:DNA-binding CsgD family transcriptional regulator
MTASGHSPGSESASSHRVLASELFADLPPTRRHSLHRAAAEVASGASVWLHRVAAATSVDESLAAALETAARSSPPAGVGRPGPAQLLQWASDLSVDQAGRERRLLCAAVHQVSLGEAGSARLWRRVQACAPSALRSCALSARARLDGRPLEAEYQLDRAFAHQSGPSGPSGPSDRPDPVLAIAYGLKAALRADAALGQQTVDAATAGLAAGSPDRGLARWLTRLLAAGRCYTDGPSAALDTLIGTDGTERVDVDRREPATLVALGCYRMLCGQPEAAIADLSELLATADHPLPPELEVRGQQWLALACQLSGAWREASLCAESAVAAVAAVSLTGARSGGAPHSISALLAAHRGDWTAADEQLRQARDLGGIWWPDDAVLADVAEVTIAHARGALDAGHQALHRLAAGGDASRKYRVLWLPLRAQALVESGREHAAEAVLAELHALAGRVPYLNLAWHRLSGRLAERRRDPVAARRHYEAARTLPPECFTVPFQAGLLEHSHGRLICGLGDDAEGPALLARARSRLTAIGATPYAQRSSTDVVVPRRGADTRPPHGALTNRERAVARLVAAGLTNSEAAARLYVSVKTVEYHLAQIYGKLGITSRRQLSRFASTSPDFAPDQGPT